MRFRTVLSALLIAAFVMALSTASALARGRLFTSQPKTPFVTEQLTRFNERYGDRFGLSAPLAYGTMTYHVRVNDRGVPAEWFAYTDTEGQIFVVFSVPFTPSDRVAFINAPTPELGGLVGGQWQAELIPGSRRDYTLVSIPTSRMMRVNQTDIIWATLKLATVGLADARETGTLGTMPFAWNAQVTASNVK